MRRRTVRGRGKKQATKERLPVKTVDDKPQYLANIGEGYDPLAFAASVSFVPDPWQRRVLTSPGKRLLLNCSRQSGKSTVAALAALHQAHFHPGSLVLLVSPTLRQSRSFSARCRSSPRGCPLPRRSARRATCG